MAREVRFSKQVQSGHAARLRKLVPHRLVNDAESEILDDLFAEPANRVNIAKEFGWTSISIHQPFSSNIHACPEVPVEFEVNRRRRQGDSDGEPQQVTARDSDVQGC